MYDAKLYKEKTSKRCLSHTICDRGYFSSYSDNIVSGCKGFYGNIYYNSYLTNNTK